MEVPRIEKGVMQTFLPVLWMAVACERTDRNVCVTPQMSRWTSLWKITFGSITG